MLRCFLFGVGTAWDKENRKILEIPTQLLLLGTQSTFFQSATSHRR